MSFDGGLRVGSLLAAVGAAPRPLCTVFLAFAALPPPLRLAEFLETIDVELLGLPRLHQLLPKH